MNPNAIFKFFAIYLPALFTLVIIITFFFNLIDKPIFISLILGFLISFINFLIGFVSIKRGINKSDKSFLFIVLGGIIIRFFITFLSIITVLVFLDVSPFYFIFTVFIIYFYYLVVEIFYLKSLMITENL